MPAAKSFVYDGYDYGVISEDDPTICCICGTCVGDGRGSYVAAVEADGSEWPAGVACRGCAARPYVAGLLYSGTIRGESEPGEDEAKG